MGKTNKEKEKDKKKSADKSKLKDKVPKALKAGGGGASKGKKKWSKTKSKEKTNNTVFWTKPLIDKLNKDVINSQPYITPTLISEKLKVNVSLAREALRMLREEEKVAPTLEFHHRFCAYQKTANFKLEEKPKEEKKEGGAKKPAAKK